MDGYPLEKQCRAKLRVYIRRNVNRIKSRSFFNKLVQRGWDRQFEVVIGSCAPPPPSGIINPKLNERARVAYAR